MNYLVELSLKSRFLILFASVSLAFYSWLTIDEVAIDLLPEFKPLQIEVQTEALGLSALEVENLVTLSIEEMLNATPWVEGITSTSVSGLSSVVVTFERGVDPLRARQLVQENLSLAHMLPHVADTPVILQPTSSTNRVMMIGLTSEEHSLIDLSVMARWNLVPVLVGVPGVANIATWGQKDRQLQVQVSPESLQRNGLDIDDIIKTTGDAFWVSPLTYLNSSTAGSGGWIDTPNQRLGIMHLLPISDEGDLSRVTVPTNAGDKTLGEITQVVEGHPPLIGTGFVNNKEGIVMVIEKFPEANVMTVARDLEAKLETLAYGLDGVEINTNIFAPAKFINLVARDIAMLLVFGFIATLLLFWAFYRWNFALVASLTIYGGLVFSLTVLSLIGETLNLLALTGALMALCLLIDDVVVSVNALTHQKNSGQKSRLEIIQDSLANGREVLFMATIGSALFICVLFFVPGNLGLFLQSVAKAYFVAVGVGLAVSVFLFPALLALFYPRTNEVLSTNDVQSQFFAAYQVQAARFARLPIVPLVLVMPIVAVIFGFSVKNNWQAMPEIKDPNLVISWDEADGTSLPSMIESTSDFVNSVSEVEGVQAVATHIGRAVFGDQKVGINSAKIWLNIGQGNDYQSVKEALISSPNEAIDYEFNSYTGEILKSIQTPPSEMFVRVYGPEFNTLEAEAQKVKAALSDIDGVSEVEVVERTFEEHVEIEVDLEKAKTYGVKPGDVRRTSATLINGLNVGFFFEEQKVYEVMVWGVPEIRSNFSDIENIQINTPGGQLVALNEVAEVTIEPITSRVERSAFSRYVDVKFQFTEANKVVPAIQTMLAEKEFTVEYRGVLVNQYQENKDQMWVIIFAIIVISLAIYLIVQSLLNSWTLAGVIMLSLPFFPFGGVLLGGMVNGWVFSWPILFGFFATFALSLRTMVLLCKNYQSSSVQSERSDNERLETVFGSMVMSSLVIVVVFAPFLLMGNQPGHEVTFIFSMVVVGGIITSTLLNLFLLPFIYLKFKKNA